MSCPFMGLMAPLMDDNLWDVDTILKNLSCYTCNQECYNDWHVCLRRSASVNLHPNYCSRERQFWFVGMVAAKYFGIPENYDGPIYKFNGLLSPVIRPMMLSNPVLPRTQKKSKLISYGKKNYI